MNFVKSYFLALKTTTSNPFFFFEIMWDPNFPNACFGISKLLWSHMPCFYQLYSVYHVSSSLFVCLFVCLFQLRHWQGRKLDFISGVIANVAKNCLFVRRDLSRTHPHTFNMYTRTHARTHTHAHAHTNTLAHAHTLYSTGFFSFYAVTLQWLLLHMQCSKLNFSIAASFECCTYVWCAFLHWLVFLNYLLPHVRMFNVG